MKKIQSEIYFESESLENLLNKLIEQKIKEVTLRLKSGEAAIYNQSKNYSSTNNQDEKVGETK